MADDSELDYIRTFIGAVCTGYTVKSFSENKNIWGINDTQRALVYPGELMTMGDYFSIKRYQVSFSDASESALTTGLNNLSIGCWKFNTRQTIAGYTKAASMDNIKVASGNKAWEHGRTKRWDQDIYIDVQWVVS